MYNYNNYFKSTEIQEGTKKMQKGQNIQELWAVSNSKTYM